LLEVYIVTYFLIRQIATRRDLRVITLISAIMISDQTHNLHILVVFQLIHYTFGSRY